MSLPDNWLPRDMAGLMLHGQGTRPLPCTCSPTAQHAPRVSRKGSVAARAAAAAPAADQNLGFKTMRRGIKEASAESVLTPRFYTTDFEQMEEMFSLDKNPGMLRPGTPAATTSQLHKLHGQPASRGSVVSSDMGRPGLQPDQSTLCHPPSPCCVSSPLQRGTPCTGLLRILIQG